MSGGTFDGDTQGFAIAGALVDGALSVAPGSRAGFVTLTAM